MFDNLSSLAIQCFVAIWQRKAINKGIVHWKYCIAGVYWAQTFSNGTGVDASDAIASEICNALQNLSSFPLWLYLSRVLRLEKYVLRWKNISTWKIVMWRNSRHDRLSKNYKYEVWVKVETLYYWFTILCNPTKTCDEVCAWGSLHQSR